MMGKHETIGMDKPDGQTQKKDETQDRDEHQKSRNSSASSRRSFCRAARVVAAHARLSGCRTSPIASSTCPERREASRRACWGSGLVVDTMRSSTKTPTVRSGRARSACTHTAMMTAHTITARIYDKEMDDSGTSTTFCDTHHRPNDYHQDHMQHGEKRNNSGGHRHPGRVARTAETGERCGSGVGNAE